MTSERKFVAVSEIAEPLLGGTPSRNVPEYWNGNIPWITAKEVASVKGRYIMESGEAITLRGLEESAAKRMPAGTVIITARGTVGAIAQLGKEMAFNQTCYGLVPRKNVDQNFLFYALKASLSKIKAISYGTVFDTITMKSFDHLTIPLPGLSEQRAIAHILGTLDDKIELNRRMSETLEAIARAIFKSWFVDFDPVIDNAILAGYPIPSALAEKAARRRDMLARAKAEGRDSCFPKDIADIFPARFIDSDLGPIPEGWVIKTVGGEVEIVKGVSYRSHDLLDSEIALVTLKSFNRGGGYRPEGLKPYVGEYKKEQIIQPGELIVAQTDVTQAAEVIGKPALVLPDDHYKTLVASLDVLIIRPKSTNLPREFFYLLFLSSEFQEHIYGHTNGTTVLHLGKNGIPSFIFAKPSRPIAFAFSDFVTPQFKKIETNFIESRTLAALRDALLPKLISGELRVKDAEKFLKERGL